MSLHLNQAALRSNVEDYRVESTSRKCTTGENIMQHEAFDAYGANMSSVSRHAGTGNEGDIMSCII